MRKFQYRVGQAANLPKSLETKPKLAASATSQMVLKLAHVIRSGNSKDAACFIGAYDVTIPSSNPEDFRRLWGDRVGMRIAAIARNYGSHPFRPADEATRNHIKNRVPIGECDSEQ